MPKHAEITGEGFNPSGIEEMLNANIVAMEAKYSALEFRLDFISQIKIQWLEEQTQKLLAQTIALQEQRAPEGDEFIEPRQFVDGSSRYNLNQRFIGCGFRWTATNKISVFAGSIRLFHKTNVALSEIELTFTNSTEWVYANYVVATGVGTIVNSATEPVSDDSNLKIAMYKFVADGDRWSLSRVCNWGDPKIDFFADNSSLNYNSDAESQLYNWATAAARGSAMTADDLLPAHNSLGQLEYLSLADLTGGLPFGLYTPLITYNAHDHSASDPTQVAHTNLSWGADDHNGTNDTINKYTQMAATIGTAARNAFAAGTMIGDSSSRNSISPDLHRLYGTDENLSLDYTARSHNDAAGTALTSWTTAGIFEFLAACTAVKLTNATLANAVDTGSLQLQGGFSARKQSYLSDGTLTLNMLVAGAGGAALAASGGAGGTAVLSGGTYAVDTSQVLGSAGGINSDGGFFCADVEGRTVSDWFTGGILTGTGVSSRVIQFPDGQGGVVDLEVLVRTP